MSVTEKITGNAGDDITVQIRSVIADHGRLNIAPESIADDDDLFRLGLTSSASVSLMLGLENTFGIEFPDEMLRKEVFGSIAAIRNAITSLQPQSGGL